MINYEHIETDKTIENMEKLFSKKYGLISGISNSGWGVIRVPTHDCMYLLGNAIPMYSTSVVNKSSSLYSGAGVSLNKKMSKMRAYGEFIERYCGSYMDNETAPELIFDSYSNLEKKGVDCLDLGRLLPFYDYQYDCPKFPYSKYSAILPISWIKGKELTSCKEVLLPAQKVFIYFCPQSRGESLYIHGMSTGLACGSNYISAILSAMYEVVERDSLMLTWLLRLPGSLVVLDKFRSNQLAELYSHYKMYIMGGDNLFIYDISRTTGIYTILSFIRNDLFGSFGLIVATASHTDPEIAIYRTLEELCQSYPAAYALLLKDKKRECYHLKPNEIDTLDKHLLFYSSSHNNKNIDFVSKGNKILLLSEMRNNSTGIERSDLDYLLMLFRKAGSSVFVADVTRPEIRASGFRVLRAIVPEYVDLEPNHNVRHLKSERLRNFQEKFGSDINDNPHPFP